MKFFLVFLLFFLFFFPFFFPVLLSMAVAKGKGNRSKNGGKEKNGSFFPALFRILFSYGLFFRKMITRFKTPF